MVMEVEVPLEALALVEVTGGAGEQAWYGVGGPPFSGDGGVLAGVTKKGREYGRWVAGGLGGAVDGEV